MQPIPDFPGIGDRVNNEQMIRPGNERVIRTLGVGFVIARQRAQFDKRK